MYYRRKLLLSILDIFEGELSNTYLQKVLFLVTRLQTKKSYDFVPYKYGCYSFQANQDLNTLSKYGLIEKETKNNQSTWKLIENDSMVYKLNKEDKQFILDIKKEIEFLPLNKLVKHTYIKYPFFATKSQIAERLLSDEELKKVNEQKRNYKEQKVFTIGYEGVSLEKYLNKLIINDVKLLCDVRKNPLSMKYGFSKNRLKSACEAVGIEYLHIPQLGIVSSKRQKLNNQKDYDILFKEYEKTTLKENKEYLLLINDYINEYSRIALTCFEKEVCMCHRGVVLKNIINQENWDIPHQNL
ncbi:DUF488 family protein [Bernardetia sp. ABR2-2B]|uniref:DUF488 family protein n=1 Tax=Bernardetia sp. ABR2-2B TaxID=3127472 RepID=UPI0030CBBA20